MPCIPLTSVITLPCSLNSSGGYQVYIGTFDPTTTFTQNAATASNPYQVSAMAGVTGSYYMVQQDQEIIELNISSPAAVGVGYDQKVVFQIRNLGAATLAQVDTLRRTALIRVIVEDQNGNFFWIGAKNGARISVEASIGKTMQDLNGFTLTAEAKEPYIAYQLAGLMANALIVKA